MFPFRQILNPSIRVIRHLQSKITSIQSVQNQIFHVQYYNFSLSKGIFLQANDQIQENELVESEKQKLGQIQPKMYIIFICKKCNTKNSKSMSKHAYEKGVVIIRCDGCKNNHLIADNLGWFADNSSRNIEQILKKKGENVRRIRNDTEGYFEAYHDELVVEPQITDKYINEGKDYVDKECKKIESLKNKK